MKDRNKLANEITDLLLQDEKKGMSLWKEHVDYLRINNDNLPEIDVLTSVYNGEEFVADALESILWQSYPNINLIIVTDPCSDRTVEIIKDFQNRYSRILLVENKERKGFIESLNIGLKHTNSKYVVRMDLDDLIHPLKFERQYEYLASHSDCDVVSTDMVIFNERHETKPVTFRADYEMHKITMMFFSPISHAASMFKGDVIRNLGYVTGYDYAEDYNLWTRLLKHYKTSVMQSPLYLYRTHSQQVTNERNKPKLIQTLRKIAADIMGNIGLELSEDDIAFYVDNIMLSGEFKNEEDFIRFDRIMQKVIKANRVSGFINEPKLKQYIFVNYWQSHFMKFLPGMKAEQFGQLYRSAYNLFGWKQRLKMKLKRII